MGGAEKMRNTYCGKDFHRKGGAMDWWLQVEETKRFIFFKQDEREQEQQQQKQPARQNNNNSKQEKKQKKKKKSGERERTDGRKKAERSKRGTRTHETEHLFNESESEDTVDRLIGVAERRQRARHAGADRDVAGTCTYQTCACSSAAVRAKYVECE